MDRSLLKQEDIPFYLLAILHITQLPCLIYSTIVNKKVMKNVLSIKLTLPCFLLFLILSAESIVAQNIKRNTLGDKIEKKAEKSDYIVHEQGDEYFIYNKHNSLMIYESDYEKKTEMLDYDKVVKFYGRAKIDSLVYKIIAPFYQNYKSKYSDKIGSFDINLYSKPNGQICELSFSLSRDVNVPIKTIEKLEDTILSLGLKLEFDPHSDYVKDALWVHFPVMYSVLTMKEKLKAGNK